MELERIWDGQTRGRWGDLRESLPRLGELGCRYLPSPSHHPTTYPSLSSPLSPDFIFSTFFSVLLQMSSTAPFRVRVRLPTSKQETLTLQRPVTIKSLLEGIQPFVNVELNQIGIKIAYPSKVVELGGPESWDREVKDVGINSGESLVITIQENDTSTTAATTQPSTSFAATDLSGGRVSTPVQKPSTAMEEPISVQPVKLRTTTFDSMTAEKRPSNLSPSNTSSPAKRSKGPSVQDEPPEVEIEGGTIVLRIMEDDNSCM